EHRSIHFIHKKSISYQDNRQFNLTIFLTVTSATTTTIMAATEDDIVDEFFKTIGTIQSMKNNLDNAYLDGIKEILKEAKKKVSAHTGIYLHDNVKTKPDKDTLQKKIAAVPLSLSYTNDEGQLPIQSAVWGDHSVGYIPLLVKEGRKHQVGGHDNRGGFLVGDPHDSDRINVLQLLADLTSDSMSKH
ncbi:unnamed protein product, partial [marine sediment metagenome]